MKKLLLILLLGGACLGGYYLKTGQLPWTALSHEEEQVAAIREEFGLVRPRAAFQVREPDVLHLFHHLQAEDMLIEGQA